MTTAELYALLQGMTQQRTPDTGPPGAPQLAGQGVVGQGLAAQQQALGPGLLGGGPPAPPQPPGPPSGPPMPSQPMPSPTQGMPIEQIANLIGPDALNPDQLAQYRASKNISPPKGLLQQIWEQVGMAPKDASQAHDDPHAFLRKLMGQGDAQAGSK